MNDQNKSNRRILLIDKDLSLVMSLYQMLSYQHTVYVVRKGLVGIEKAQKIHFDLIVLDYDLLDVNGPRLIKFIRDKGITSKILVVNDAADTQTRIECFKYGANYFLKKPFSLEELKIIANILLRDRPLPKSCDYYSDDIKVFSNTHQVLRENQLIDLRKKEFQILECLFRNAQKVVSKAYLAEAISDKKPIKNNCLEVHIKNLRDKVDRKFIKEIIITCTNKGYKLLVTNPKVVFKK